MGVLHLEELTLAVCNVARQAGAFIRQERTHFSAASIERKHSHDYVSYVDKQSEMLIVESLRHLLPQADFITEEGTAASAAERTDPSEQLCWVIDPLDGTTNFIHRFPPYAVSIALVQGSDILLGAVYEICADECFYAWKGGGSYVDGQPLHVSQSAIDDALLCLQLPYNSQAYKPVIQCLINTFYGRAASVRMLGSAAIALCYVAAGRLDAYVEKYIGQWDYMAGALIVSEAGGRVTNFDGSPQFTQGNSIVATNAIIHNEMLQVTAGEIIE
ncbi:MAG: inositol monophosphatase [Prevotella sp.]|nr:inositol monophosphatase [Prevotella sp.]